MKESIEDRVQKFLDREMNDEEIQQLDQDLQTDEALADHLAFEVSLRRAMEKKRKLEIKEMIENSGVSFVEHSDTGHSPQETIREIPTNKVRNLRSWFQVAAAAILLIGAYFLFFNSPPDDFSTIANFEAVEKIRDENSYDLNISGGDGLGNYGAGKYLLSRLAFEKEEKKDIERGLSLCDRTERNYYLGTLYLYQSNEYRKAIEKLECCEVDKSNVNKFKDKVPFHLAVSYIRAGLFEKADLMIKKYNISNDSFEKDDLKKLKQR